MIIKIIKEGKYSQFVKFFAIGGISALLDLAILYILTDIVGIYYIYSAIIGFVIVTSLAFFAHKNITFNCDRKDKTKQYMLFFIVNIMGLLIYSILLYIGVDLLKFYYMYVAVLCKFLVFIWNFFANKLITFKKIND